MRLSIKGRACTLMSIVLLVGGIFLVSSNRNAQVFYGWLRGDSLVVTPASMSVHGSLGEKKPFKISFNNVTSQDISLIGVSATCLCVSLGEVPVTIRPGQSVEFPLAIELKGAAGKQITQTVSFVTDCVDQSYITVAIDGTIDSH